MTTARAVEDAQAAVRSSAAALDAAARTLTEAAVSPAQIDGRTLRALAMTVQAQAQRAALAAAGATFAAGQLAAYAHVLNEAWQQAAAEIEAEAARDAALYGDDRRDNPATCPTREEWCREMFAENWAECWDELGIERGPAEALYTAAFARSAAKLDGTG